MRIITLILSIYIFALNFIICADTNIVNKQKTEIAQNHNHEHDSSDLCSPFCHCQCCQVFATNLFSLDFNLRLNKILNNIFVHFDNIGKEITFLILQPPIV